MDEYLRRFAEQQRRRWISSVYVLSNPSQPVRILGDCTLSVAEVDRQRLTEVERKKLPGCPVPCFRIGQLACRTDQRGFGFGKLLLGCAVDRRLKARQQVAAYALLVDAENDVAKAFCAYLGFDMFPDAPLTLYLPPGR